MLTLLLKGSFVCCDYCGDCGVWLKSGVLPAELCPHSVLVRSSSPSFPLLTILTTSPPSSCYRVYVSLAISTCFPLLFIWFSFPHALADFTPAYAFLVFPMMLTGVVAFKVLKVMRNEDSRVVGVLLSGYIFQGE